MMLRKILSAGFIGAIFIVVLISGHFRIYEFFRAYFDKSDYYRVKYVIDGDTILLENNQEVRYLGLNAPEIRHGTVREECFGVNARDYNKSLIADGRVRLIKGPVDKDSYGRLVRYVFTEKGEFINYDLVKNGYAQILEQPPLPVFNNLFYLAQSVSRDNKKGIWGDCLGKTSKAENNSRGIIRNYLSYLEPSLFSGSCIFNEDLNGYAGQYRCVRFYVTGARLGKNSVLWLDNGKKAPDFFSVTVFPDSGLPSTANLLQVLNHKMIEVSGIINVYHSQPTIIVYNSGQLRLLP